MLIAALDNDRQFTKHLQKLLNSLLTDVEFVAFDSPEDCINYTMEHEVSLIFIDQNIGENFSDLQLLHHKLRKIRPHVDMLIVYNENKWDNSVAVWSIQSRCSDYICKSAAAERFQDALQNIWFNPIEDTNLLNLIN